MNSCRIVCFFIWLLLFGCGRQGVVPSQEALPARFRSAAPVDLPRSQSCQNCHSRIYEQWGRSHHAKALRMLDPKLDDAAFAQIEHEMVSFTSRFSQVKGDYVIEQTGPDGWAYSGHPDAVLGYTPLIQYLVPFPGGRWQVFDPAYDPRSNEWFGVYGDQDRMPEEWGHWSRMGMNWNQQCAYCHTTAFQKNYDAESNSFSSTWSEIGVGCIQCHPPLEAGHTRSDGCTVQEQDLERSLHMETCASCHARREELTEGMPAGARFLDHYRLILPDSPEIYFADGQVLDEDYVYGSFLMSRMHAKGVTCFDCHNAHSGETILPVENNAICMQCHIAPVRLGAQPIDPLAHSFHAEGSTGNQCVNCHMPFTTYMERDPRRDHGFIIPDPLLTVEHGIPNACNRCHSEESPEWALEKAEQWYGSNLNSRVRDRSRWVARAYEGDPAAVDPLLELYAKEEIPVWRASLLVLAVRLDPDGRTLPILREAQNDESPLVREAAIRGLFPMRQGAMGFEKLLRDPSRSVRVRAAEALSGTLLRSDPAYQEMRTWLRQIHSQPSGALREAELALREGRIQDVRTWADRMLAGESVSGDADVYHGQLLYQAGDVQTARQSFERAVERNPDRAFIHFHLALLMAEMGDVESSLGEFRKTVELEPAHSRARYNLGLALAQREELVEAAAELTLAADSGESPDYAYALATVYLRMSQPEEALAAIEENLSRFPQHRPSLRLYVSLQTPPAK